MAKIDVERVISEYFMLKTVLKNKYAMDVVFGKVEPAGPTAAADKRTLQAMQRYVRTLDELVIAGNGLSKGETLEKYLERISNTFKEKEAAKPESRRIEYSENPFDDNFKYFVTAVLGTENAKSKIEKAITSNKPVLDSVNSLAINLGGKKQSSYVRLLAESTELFSTVSGLRAEVDQLNKSKNADKDKIKNLRSKLAAKTKEAENYRQLLEKAIEELGENSGSTMLVGILRETNNSLEGLIRQEAQATREHVTGETNRVIDTMQRKDKIKAHILENPKKYPRYIAIYKGTELNNRGLKNLHNEIQYAATQVQIPEEDSAVVALFNEASEQNLKNSIITGREKTKPAGSKVVPVILGVGLGLSILGGALLGVSNIHLHQDLHQANETIANIQENQGDTTYQQRYAEYVARENEQLDDYNQKLQIALNDGTYVTIDNNGQVVPGDSSVNGWNQTTLDELIQKYSEDDNIAEFKWSSTDSMRQQSENAINSEKASYYQEHYEEMLDLVEDLNAEIESLNQELQEAYNDLNNASNQISQLSVKVSQLESQIEDLQSIIDAAGGNGSALQEKLNELQTKLDEANAKISTLQAENDALTAENQALKAEIAELENSIGGLNDRINSLENENQVLATEKAALQIEAADLQSTIDELNAKLEALVGTDAYQQITALEQKIDSLESQLEEANAKINSLESTNEALTNQIVKLEGSIDELEGSVSDLTESVKNLTDENTSLKAEVEQVKEDLTKSMNDFNELLEKYNTLKENGGASLEDIQALEAELANAYNIINSYEEQIVELYNGITKQNTNTTQAQQDLESLFKLFGIDYNEQDAPSNDGSEYQR